MIITDLKIYHQNSSQINYIENEIGTLVIQNEAANGDIIVKVASGSGAPGEIARFDGGDQGLKFKDGKKIIMGDSGDIQIQSDNSNQII